MWVFQRDSIDVNIIDCVNCRYFNFQVELNTKLIHLVRGLKLAIVLCQIAAEEAHWPKDATGRKKLFVTIFGFLYFHLL